MNLRSGLILWFLVVAATSFITCTDEDPEPSPADARQAFAGTWQVTETETKLTYTAEIQIDPRSLNGGVFIINFANAGSSSEPAYAIVSNKTITLEVNQVIGDDWIINGSGILSGSTINWPYTLNDGANLHTIQATFVRL